MQVANSGAAVQEVTMQPDEEEKKQASSKAIDIVFENAAEDSDSELEVLGRSNLFKQSKYVRPDPAGAHGSTTPSSPNSDDESD